MFLRSSIHDVVHSVRNRGEEAQNKPLQKIFNGYRNRYSLNNRRAKLHPINFEL